MNFRTKNKKETQKIAKTFARAILTTRTTGRKRSAVVLALVGNLGAGKTAFVQGLAKGFGIKEIPKSPTFILMQIFALPRNKKQETRNKLIHIDAYRLSRTRDMLSLGFKQILKDPNAIVVVEWAEKVRPLLPRDATWVYFKHKGKNKREISVKM